MKKDCTRFNYIWVIISVLIIGCTTSVLYKEMEEKTWHDSLIRARNSSSMNKKYVDNMFDSALDLLSVVADNVKDENFSDTRRISKKLMVNNGMFSDVSLIDSNGIKVYGACMYNQFAHSESYEAALLGRSVINSIVTNDHDNKKQICIFVPVISNGKIKGIVIGSILQDSINNFLESNMIEKGDGICVIDKNGKYICGNKGFFEMVGSSNGNYLNYMKKVKLLRWKKNVYSLKKDISNGDIFEVNYKDGSSENISVGEQSKYNNWYVVSNIDAEGEVGIASILSSKSIVLITLSFVDIAGVLAVFIYLTKKHCKEKNLISKVEELAKIENSVLFEYKFSPKCFHILMNYGNIPSGSNKKLRGESVYDIYNYVHEDDISIRSSVRKFFESGEDVFTSEVRILNSNSEYEWYKITGTLVRDELGNNIAFIGKFVDANKQISEEKNLVQRAENDLLTGVLNKKTMEEKITELLTTKKNDRYYIFFMVDLDNFKNVNDTLGHIYGDKAICDTANVLSDIFKTNALVGRLGGDEFAVCATYDAFDEESLSQYIIKKAEKIKAANQRSYTDGASQVNISSSVGIAVAPTDGEDFATIYQRADSALYKSKKTGKNKYTRFSINISE